MTKAHFCFGTSFFLLATTSTFLLVWTCWWLAVVGPSVPARRPFFRAPGEVPQLIQTASTHVGDPLFQFALPGGWPTVNSALRLVAALLAVLCSLSFAFVASLAPARKSRTIFTVGLSAVALFALVATVMDSVTLGKTAAECSKGQCVTNVPDDVLASDSICICSVDAWYYFTLATDAVLFLTALICLVLTAVPKFHHGTIDSSR